jgi:hypothetical protein
VSDQFIAKLLARQTVPESIEALQKELEAPLPDIILPASFCKEYKPHAPDGVTFITSESETMQPITGAVSAALSMPRIGDTEMCVGEAAERHTTNIWTVAGRLTTQSFKIIRNGEDDTEATLDNKKPDSMTLVNNALMAKVRVFATM